MVEKCEFLAIKCEFTMPGWVRIYAPETIISGAKDLVEAFELRNVSICVPYIGGIPSSKGYAEQMYNTCEYVNFWTSIKVRLAVAATPWLTRVGCLIVRCISAPRPQLSTSGLG